MALYSKLLHELSQEVLLVIELVFENVELLLASEGRENFNLVVLDKCTELLYTDKDLRDKLSYFCLFSSKHRSVKNFVQKLVMSLNKVFKHLNRLQLLLEHLPTSINGINHQVLLKSIHEALHSRSCNLNGSQCHMILSWSSFKLNGVQFFPGLS